MDKWKWIISKYARLLWVRASLFSLLGVATALFAAWFKYWIPVGWGEHIGADAVDDILKIIASSMLAVTTFSLGIVVSAYSSASNAATPRATALLISDTTAHNALSTFIGAFLFSIVGIVMLKTGVYEQQGRVLLFIVTILVIALIVYTLLRWIHHLSQLGRLGSTVDMVEETAIRTLRERLADPFLGGSEWRSGQRLPAHAIPVPAPRSGYLQAVDVATISKTLGDHGIQGSAYINAMPGRFVDPSVPLLHIAADPADEDLQDAEALHDALQGAFSIDTNRSFDFDPRFGAVVMSEVASRALSAAINDSGTVIDLIGRSVRVFRVWLEKDELQKGLEVKYPNVLVPAMQLQDYFDDFFPIIARDGAGLAEVGVRLQKALHSLAHAGDAEMTRIAKVHSQRAYQHSLQSLKFDFDLYPIKTIHDEIQKA